MNLRYDLHDNLLGFVDYAYHLPIRMADNGWYANTPVFLSVGETIAALAILLTIYQLIKEKFSIAIKIKQRVLGSVFICAGLSIFSIFISTFMSPPFVDKPKNVLQLSLTWQIVSAILLLLSIRLMFTLGSNRKLFIKYPAELTQALARRVPYTPSEFNQIADLLRDNLDDVFEALLKPEQTKCHEFSVEIFRSIIGHKSFSQYLVSTRADLVHFFLYKITSLNLVKNGHIKVVFSTLVKSLFEDKDSQLYVELRNTKRTRAYCPLVNSIFANPQIFQELRPFSGIQFQIGEQTDADKLELFLLCAETAFENYFGSRIEAIPFHLSHYSDIFRLLHDGFDRLDEAVMEKDDGAKPEWRTLNKIRSVVHFLRYDFVNIYREAWKKGLVNDSDKECNVSDSFGEMVAASLTGQYAITIFKVLCKINRYKDSFYRRHFALDLTNQLFWVSDESLKNIKNTLVKVIWNKINQQQYSSDIYGSYPVILPIYLSVFRRPSDQKDKWKIQEYNRIIEFMDSELKPLIKENKTMINGELMEDILLPGEVKFNREKDVFVWLFNRGETQSMTKVESTDSRS